MRAPLPLINSVTGSKLITISMLSSSKARKLHTLDNRAWVLGFAWKWELIHDSQAQSVCPSGHLSLCSSRTQYAENFRGRLKFLNVRIKQPYFIWKKSQCLRSRVWKWFFFGVFRLLTLRMASPLIRQALQSACSRSIASGSTRQINTTTSSNWSPKHDFFRINVLLTSTGFMVQ